MTRVRDVFQGVCAFVCLCLCRRKRKRNWLVCSEFSEKIKPTEICWDVSRREAVVWQVIWCGLSPPPIWKKIASCQPISCFARISFKIFQSFFFFFSFAVIYTSTTTSPKVKLPFSFCWNLYFFTARDALRGRHSSFHYQTEWNGTLVKWRWISNTRSEISWECMYTVVYNKYSPVAYFILNYLFSQL